MSTKSSSKAVKKSSKKADDVSVEEMYVKKTHHEHVLSIPDTYVSSVIPEVKDMWVYNRETHKIVKREITYVQGLYKIFDEVLVNARDHTIREPTCKRIDVVIDKETGKISVSNDGHGIRVEMHKKYNVYAPELILGQLLTSGNYDAKGKTVGGKNGYGAKLVNIFSILFEIDIVDAKTKKIYHQTFADNMYTINPPKISDAKPKDKPQTKISFVPDYLRFGITELTDDIIALFEKRTFDIAATTDPSIKVYLNGKLIKINSFDEYVGMFYDDEDERIKKMVYEDVNDRWKIGAIFDNKSSFNHTSFVNGIWTFQGGSHVTAVLDQITKRLLTIIHAKHKDIIVKPSQIRDNLTLFIDCVIEDPGFNSQIKECLTTKVSDFVHDDKKKSNTFESFCKISDGFIEKLAKSGIITEVVNMAKFKADGELKKTDGKKNKSLRGMAKLDDAEWAGTNKSHLCKLIVTEGDSAKSFAVSGLSMIGTEQYGVFPLKGKPINAREVSTKALLKNEEFCNIKQILGLKNGKKYTEENIKELRYGGIIILTDQDVDGSHIKGLLMNMIHSYWPTLLKIDGFIQSMATPIVKVHKKSDKKINKSYQSELTFYNLNDYNEWTNSVNPKLWVSKYFKGLGTSTDEEAVKAFIDFDKKIISYQWEPPVKTDDDNNKNDQQNNNEINDEDDELDDINSKSHDALLLAFEKKRANDRKLWLDDSNLNVNNDKSTQYVPYSTFINEDLREFSIYDNVRSIPSVCDGFKPSQRKVMHGCKKKKMKTEIKVAEIAAFISENTKYHHGETSLQGTIVGQAQQFVGSNNINLLYPSGNFGHRWKGGKDAASPRYIFTKLENITNKIFRSEDDKIYEYNVDDGNKIEPVAFAPIIPMCLVNGCKGIGTGWSTSIPSYNPLDIAHNIKRMLHGEQILQLSPWYKGFVGDIKKEKNNFTTFGKYNILNETTIHITELPIGTWTEDYKAYLDNITLYKEDDPSSPEYKKKILSEYFVSPRTDNIIDIRITFNGGEMQKLIKNDTLVKTLQLTSSISTSNMCMFNENGKITKYDELDEIFEEFYNYRLKMYGNRKKQILKILKNHVDILKYKIKFIQEVINEKIIIGKKKKTVLIEELENNGYPMLSTIVNNDDDVVNDNDIDDDDNDDNNDSDDDDNKNANKNGSYNYLLDMKLWMLTYEKLEELKKQMENEENEYERYNKLTIENIWESEIDEFIECYKIWLKEELSISDDINVKGKKGSKTKASKNKKLISKK